MKRDFEMSLAKHGVPLDVVGRGNSVSAYWRVANEEFYQSYIYTYYDCEDYLDGYKLSYAGTSEIYASLDDVCARIYGLVNMSYPLPQDVDAHDSAFMLVAKTKDVNGFAQVSIDMIKKPAVNGRKSFKELAYEHFPMCNVARGKLVFETNVYSNRVARNTRRSIANVFTANSKFFKTYNVKDICLTRWKDIRFVVDDEILDDDYVLSLGITRLKSTTYDCAFVTGENKYVVRPSAEGCGFVLRVTDKSDHFE